MPLVTSSDQRHTIFSVETSSRRSSLHASPRVPNRSLLPISRGEVGAATLAPKAEAGFVLS